jgi:tetratricopeptide (TPR) repeat protein
LEKYDVDLLIVLRKELISGVPENILNAEITSENFESHLKPIFSVYSQASAQRNMKCTTFIREYVSLIEKEWKVKPISKKLDEIDNPPKSETEEGRIEQMIERIERRDKVQIQNKPGLVNNIIGDKRTTVDFGRLAEQFLDMKNYVQSSFYFSKILDFHPKFVFGYLGRGLCEGYLQNNTVAKADFLKAIELDRHCWQAHYDLGCIYFDENKYHEAVTQYNICLLIKPNFAYAYYNRGMAFTRLGMRREAKKDFEHWMRWKDIGPKSRFIFIKDQKPQTDF